MKTNKETTEYISLVRRVRDHQRTINERVTRKLPSDTLRILKKFEAELDNYDTSKTLEKSFVTEVNAMRDAQKLFFEERNVRNLRAVQKIEYNIDVQLRPLYIKHVDDLIP